MVGRPAQHTRAGITAVALRIADGEGLDAVSMRRVAAELGTGAASLYRYVETRDELLDLMTDATAAEYDLTPSPPSPPGRPSADGWLAGLVALGEQGRAILRRHRWLAAEPHPPGHRPEHPRRDRAVPGNPGRSPGPAGRQARAFAMLNGLTATSVLYEQAGRPGAAGPQRRLPHPRHRLGRPPAPGRAVRPGPGTAARPARRPARHPPTGDPPTGRPPAARTATRTCWRGSCSGCSATAAEVYRIRVGQNRPNRAVR